MKINRQIALTVRTIITTIKQIVSKCRSHCSHGPVGRLFLMWTAARGINRPQAGGYNQLAYCLSYTATFLNFLPFGVVPIKVTVRLLLSAETTI